MNKFLINCLVFFLHLVFVDSLYNLFTETCNSSIFLRKASDESALITFNKTHNLLFRPYEGSQQHVKFISEEQLFSQSFPPVTYNDSDNIQLALFCDKDYFYCWDFNSGTSREIGNPLSLMPNYSIAVNSTFLALFAQNSTNPNLSNLTLQTIVCQDQRIMTSQWWGVSENHLPIGMFKLESKNYTLAFSKNTTGSIYVLLLNNKYGESIGNINDATRYLETSFLADLQSINKIKMIEFNDELVVCVSGGLRDMFNVTCFIGDITESNERLNFREKRGSQSVLKNCSDFQKSEYDFSLFPLNKNTFFVSCSTETNLIFNLLTPINDSFKILGYSLQ